MPPGVFGGYWAALEPGRRSDFGRLRGADKERPEEKRSCCAVGRCCERRPSARTVQYVHAVLRSALRQAMREELIARNAARNMETPTVDSKEVHPLDAGDVRLLLKTARSSPRCPPGDRPPQPEPHAHAPPPGREPPAHLRLTPARSGGRTLARSWRHSGTARSP